MVKELINPVVLTTSIPRDVAGLSKIPVSVQKLQLRLVEDVEEADFKVAVHATELVQETTISEHSVANSLVGHGYGEQFLEITAPFKDTLESLFGESYIDNEKIVSYTNQIIDGSIYKQVNAGDVAGLVNLPEAVRGMQLVVRSDSLTALEDNEGVKTIDMIAIRKRVQPAIELTHPITSIQTQVDAIAAPVWQATEPTVDPVLVEEQTAGIAQFITTKP
jgi:hypothetical protein